MLMVFFQGLNLGCGGVVFFQDGGQFVGFYGGSGEGDYVIVFVIFGQFGVVGFVLFGYGNQVIEGW